MNAVSGQSLVAGRGGDRESGECEAYGGEVEEASVAG